MTPEEICGNRSIRTISALPGAKVLFEDDGHPCILKMENARGTMEVLITEPKKEDFMSILLGDTPMTLTGFFRRRSGFRADGSRHFIWCFVLFTAEVEGVSLPTAA